MGFNRHAYLMIKRLFLLFFSLFFVGIIVMSFIVLIISRDLPDVDSLHAIELEVPLRVYASDGQLIAEFGEQRRIPVKIKDVPKDLINAVLATEDRRFYEHNGVDIRGLLRASFYLLIEGEKKQGGSTITMQVARNFFLTRQKTFTRKLSEIMLAINIERALTKDQILELYLNKVFFGYRAYGVGAAAQAYYGKPLSELTLAQMAMIAGLPQAPSAINPIVNPPAALIRRKHVLDRMYEYGYIDEKRYEAALSEPLNAQYHGSVPATKAPYVAEMVRQEIVHILGDAAYVKGLEVHTTIDSRLQSSAARALRTGLLAYDQRHGYRTPTENFSQLDKQAWPKQLASLRSINELTPSIVESVEDKAITVFFDDNKQATIEWDNLSWARKDLGNLRVTHPPKKASDIVKVGDLVYVDKQPNGKWRLAQRPVVEGAIVSVNPQNGAILALVGGFDFYGGSYNRVTQAHLQPGSNFKPFVYSAGLANGLTAASIINDAPIVVHDPNQPDWRPQNDNMKFYGPLRLREGLFLSRNAVSIRVLQAVGLKKAIEYLTRFGFTRDQLPYGFSLALGTPSVEPLELITGYATFANGGFKVEPYFIEIYDRAGALVYQANPAMACYTCDTKLATDDNHTTTATDPTAPDDQALNAPINNTESVITPATSSLSYATPPDNLAPRVIEAGNAFIITSILQDTIRFGTGKAALSLGRKDLSGKTGTTNEQMDAWFSGYNQDIVATVWVGFDQPSSLGEYGAKAALPIWMQFMGDALNGKPSSALPQPDSVLTVNIDKASGLLPYYGDKNTMAEYFIDGTAPSQTSSGRGRYDSDVGSSGSSGNNETPEQLF